MGDLQLAILRVLWERGEAVATEVHQALLEERGLAPTTIKTMLRKMDERGFVEHRVEGRTFIYRAAMAEEQVRDGMVQHLMQRLFSGNGSALVHHLIEAGEIDAEELDALRARLDDEEEKEG